MQTSKYEVTPRNVRFLVHKKEEGWWPRLLKDKAKEKFQRNGAYSTKHVRIAKEQRAKK